MTAGIIHLCGAFGGLMSGPTPNNKKGMFENSEIRNKVVKSYLRNELKVDPMGQDPLPDVNDLVETPNLRGIVQMIVKWQGYKDDPWFYKGAKLCLIWPIWHMAFPKSKWIIVRRADEDIIYSCMHTNFMRAFHTEQGWQAWIDQHKERFQEMKDAGLALREVWPTKFVEGDFSEIQEVISWLGLQWQDKPVKDFICPELWRNGNGKSSNSS